MKKKILKFVDCILIFSILIYIFISFMQSIINPKKILKNEKRYAYNYEKITLKNYINGDVQNNIENTLSDQITLSTSLKSANNMIKAITVKHYVDFYFSNHEKDYLSFNKVNFYGKDYLVYTPTSLSVNKDYLNNKINNYNKFISQYKDVDFYLYYIERDSDINFNNNKKSGNYEYIKENLNVKKSGRLEIDSFSAYSNYFFKTDHHWNYIGAYKGYLDILKLFDLKNNIEPKYTECLTNKFSGTKAKISMLNDVMKERFCVYKFDFNNIKTTINGFTNNYGKQENDKLKILNINSLYEDYYGNNDGEIIFESNDDTKNNILIIGESYDNAILKLLAENFNTTVSIDLRYYSYYMDKEFNLSYYVNKYDIHKVLFIGNIIFFTSDEFLINIGEED